MYKKTRRITPVSFITIVLQKFSGATLMTIAVTLVDLAATFAYFAAFSLEFLNCYLCNSHEAYKLGSILALCSILYVSNTCAFLCANTDSTSSEQIFTTVPYSFLAYFHLSNVRGRCKRSERFRPTRKQIIGSANPGGSNKNTGNFWQGSGRSALRFLQWNVCSQLCWPWQHIWCWTFYKGF